MAGMDESPCDRRAWISSRACARPPGAVHALLRGRVALRRTERGWLTCDACTEPDIINELLDAETYLSFGPDSLPEARNRGYRRCDRCEGMRAAQD